MLPLRYMGGLTIELEICSDPTEPIISNAYTAPAVTDEAQTINSPLVRGREAIALFQETNISRDWKLTECQIKCDVITLEINFK